MVYDYGFCDAKVEDLTARLREIEEQGWEVFQIFRVEQDKTDYSKMLSGFDASAGLDDIQKTYTKMMESLKNSRTVIFSVMVRRPKAAEEIKRV